MNNPYCIKITLNKNILEVIDRDNNIVASFPIIYGRKSNLGTKEKEGDERTPRGKYYICTINENSRFSLFFGISYPGIDDAEKAYMLGIINEEEYNEIISSISQDKRPPWNTALGGEVGIHGGGTDRDGTRGCIGMEDKDVHKLGKYVTLGIDVEII